MSAADKLGQAIAEALKEGPETDVLAAITGHFVGLTTELVRRNGGDLSMPIQIDGGLNRDITIHAPKGSPNAH